MKLKLAMTNESPEAGFINYDRIDEKVIYDAALERLRSWQGIRLEAEIMSPSEDITPGLYLSAQFVLIHDLDYGTSIRFNSRSTLEALAKVLES